ncbi:MAG TPA: DUF222 domain-containing protein [Actinomycetales bacterium]
MFDDVGALSSREVHSWLSRLGASAAVEPLVDVSRRAEPSGADLIARIGLLEQLKAACAAEQARPAVAFDEVARAQQVAAGVPARRVGRGVAEQIALARRDAPSRGGRHLAFAQALVRDMPGTLAALSAGEVSEWTATLVVQETLCLSADDRRAVDAELAGTLAGCGPARARRDAWAVACRLDPASAVARCARAVTQRRVSLRPAPDAMTYLTALLPLRQGVGVYAALDAAAGAARAGGDGRGRGQVMADTLVDRC